MKAKVGEGIPNIVIPTIRNNEFFSDFLDSWRNEFKGCHLIIVEDRNKKQLGRTLKKYSKKVGCTYQLIDHRDIDKDLGVDKWIIPRKTDCVRSYGYLLAQRNNPSFIVTLDDDISPQRNHIATFYNKLFLERYPFKTFYNTMKGGVLPRGTYGAEVGCQVVHGVWANVPDFSAKEHSTKLNFKSDINSFNEGLIPVGAPFSFCGMNVAWKPEVTKYMYFGLQGGDYPIDRCGDIWCGYRLAKEKVEVYTGRPMCTHNKASNLWTNMKKEKNAEEMSLDILLTGELLSNPKYCELLEKAEDIWTRLINEINYSKV